MPIYHKKVNGRKVWWVRVVYCGLNARESIRPRKSTEQTTADKE